MQLRVDSHCLVAVQLRVDSYCLVAVQLRFDSYCLVAVQLCVDSHCLVLRNYVLTAKLSVVAAATVLVSPDDLPGCDDTLRH